MVTKDIQYIGVDDKTLDLFEGQYVVPHGVSYNSYVILDEKVAVMDTVDHRKTAEYLANLEKALCGRKPDYLVVSHLEPDHASSIQAFVEKYPEVRLVGNAKTFQMLPQYFSLDLSHAITVAEGDSLSLGRHELTFVMAPMVHWPEVMVSYDSCDKVLFSADAFGKFGALDTDEEWDEEARRYYFNIVGKYGPQTMALLKKASGLDIEIVCPLHGPVLKGEALAHALELYTRWGSYAVEKEGVLIAYASLHGNTAAAACKLAELLRAKGCNAETVDLARTDLSVALAKAFEYGKVVFAASSYNAGLMPFMEDFLHHLKAKNYQQRTIALIENGSWAPSAVRVMKEILCQMKQICLVDPTLTIRGAVKPEDEAALADLADKLAG